MNRVVLEFPPELSMEVAEILFKYGYAYGEFGHKSFNRTSTTSLAVYEQRENGNTKRFFHDANKNLPFDAIFHLPDDNLKFRVWLASKKGEHVA